MVELIGLTLLISVLLLVISTTILISVLILVIKLNQTIKNMRGIKLMLESVAFISLFATMWLIWNESHLNCDQFGCKVFESIFVVSTVITARFAAGIKIEEEKD